MNLTLNGETYDLPTTNDDSPTVVHLLTALNLIGQPAAVELNKTLIPKRNHDQTTLTEGDSIEIVTLVGGG